MTVTLNRCLFATLVSALLAAPAFAQDDAPEPVPFADGELTVTETDDFEKVLAFDGRELARDYVVMFDRIADVGGTDVAFFSVGPGGNACAPATVMVWKPQDGEVTSATFDKECDTPSAAVSDYAVFFVPYLLPGDTADVRAWNPQEGFRLHGVIAYAPEPGTGWDNLEPAAISHPLDLFRNAAIYAAAQSLLADDLSGVATGLGTAGAPEEAGSLIYARGCVPHACGGSDTFMVVDRDAKALYFAQQGEETRFWPARDQWPQAAAGLIPSDF